MRTDSDLAWFVVACGPTLTLLLAVLVVASILQRGWKTRDDKSRMAINYTSPLVQGYDELELALEDATILNPFNPHARAEPVVPLNSD